MPGFKTFTSAVLTAADVNDYLMEQAVIQATTSTRPGSPHEGMVVASTDTNALEVYSGSAWQEFGRWGAWATFTPTVAQNTTVAATINFASYCRVGSLVICRVVATIASAGTTGNDITCTLPVAATNAEMIGGSFSYFDTGSTIYAGTVGGVAADKVAFTVSGNGNNLGTSPNIAVAVNDILRFTVQYEAA